MWELWRQYVQQKPVILTRIEPSTTRSRSRIRTTTWNRSIRRVLYIGQLMMRKRINITGIRTVFSGRTSRMHYSRSLRHESCIVIFTNGSAFHLSRAIKASVTDHGAIWKASWLIPVGYGSNLFFLLPRSSVLHGQIHQQSYQSIELNIFWPRDPSIMQISYWWR